MKPATQHYVIVDGGVVVAKRALGPDQQPDGSWTMPDPPAGGTLVDLAAYQAAAVGERGRLDERLARLLARAEKAESALRILSTRLHAVEVAVASTQTTVSILQAQGVKLRTDLKAVSDRVTILEQA